MGLKLLRWLLVIGILAFAGTAKADTVNTVKVDGSYAFDSNGYGIPPYGGTLNGQSQSFYCVDFSAHISAGDSWYVNITNLAGSDFSSTKLFATLGNSGAQTAYLEMAWLVTQMMGITDKSLKAEYQFAIWSFTGGPLDKIGSTLLQNALNAVTKDGFKGQGWQILTPQKGSIGQEFLIYVPEPSALLMLGIGLIALVVLSRKRLLA
jgi:hypothetical protein